MAEFDEFQAPEGKTKEGDGSQQYGEGGTQNVKEKLRQGLEQTREQGKRAVETVGYQIEERPLISLLVAFGAGLLVGMLFSGMRSSGPSQINEQLQEGTGTLGM